MKANGINVAGRRSSRPILGLSIALLGGAVASSQGASINYGNFSPAGSDVTFQGVQESSGTDAVPLYGPPSPFTIGLDFDPTGFVATANGGGADITDGQLNLTIQISGEKGISQVSLFEAGDYTLAGVGTPATTVSAGAILRATVTELDGIELDVPISLSPVNASFGDALPGTVIVGPWSLGVSLNVEGQIGSEKRVTELEIVIDNSLVATSEPGTVSFIGKKDFRFTTELLDGSTRVTTLNGVVAPDGGNTGWLLLAGSSFLLLVGRLTPRRVA
jgi:hypothetical protein